MAKKDTYNRTLARAAAKRRKAMLRLQKRGLSLAQIGRRFGNITRQRVHRILTRADQ